MKAFAIIVVLALGSLAAPRVTAARQCLVGCGRQKKACVQTARVDLLACRQACRTTPGVAGRSACVRACASQFATSGRTCARDRSSCLEMCSPSPPPGSCDGALVETCGQGLASCAGGVVSQAKACLGGCSGATARGICFQGCGADAEAGSAACANALAACVGGCRPPTTTTLPPPTCGLDPMAAVCGGTCPPGLICAPPPPESGVAPACVCRPPGGSCTTDQECDDGNGCTRDHCIDGSCEHICVCGDATGATSCCPGPAGLCPPPHGRCFVTVELQCSDEPCAPDQPCRNPNEICSPRCSVPPTTTTTLPTGACASDSDCDDGNVCTADRCVDGMCQHGCICLDAAGASTCCPGPSALCVRPCGVEPAGTCGGFCPGGATCEPFRPGSVCGCVSGLGGPCGGNVFGPPVACGPGLVCQQSNPDVTGVCVAQSSCIPFFQAGCTQTSDCCEPCGNGRIAPCAVCLQGQCVGTPSAVGAPQ